MKITVCRSCGLTMHSASTKCTRCNQKNLSAHDILCEDTYRLHKRINELSVAVRSPYSNPMISGMVVIALASIAVIGWEYSSHPTGKIAAGINVMWATISPQTAPHTVPIIARRPGKTL